MKKRVKLLLSFGMLLNVLPVGIAWEAHAADAAEDPRSIGREVPASVEARVPPMMGWIYEVNDRSVMIDDKRFAITKKTDFLVEKGRLGPGVFVFYRIDRERNLKNIGIAQPTELDMLHKPLGPDDSTTGPGPEQGSVLPKRKDNLRFQDGKWVN